MQILVQLCLTDKSTHYPLGMIVRPDDSVKEKATYIIIASDYVHRVILGWYLWLNKEISRSM